MSTKRQLRSNTAAEAACTTSTIEPRPAKKVKKEPVRYLCYSCDKERASSAFPDFNPSSECEHLIHTCKSCLRQWVDVQIETAQFAVGVGLQGQAFGVKCPQCPAIMKNVNVQMATTKKMHDRFEKIERKHIADNTPGWRWCLAPGCYAGQVHKSKKTTSEQKTGSSWFGKKACLKTNVIAEICTCNECGAQACVTCDRPYHEGESCTAYQARIKNRTDEEDLSILEINRITKKCPNCKKNIQKNGGCPNMYCTNCSKNFCWDCLERGWCNLHPHLRPQ